MRGGILVATDASVRSRGAVRLARGLAGRDAAVVEALAVLQPSLFYGAGFTELLPAGFTQLERVQMTELRAAVEHQLHREGAAGWAVRVEVGPVPATIVRVAGESGAGLIVLGLGQRSAVDRWLGGEVSRRVAKASQVPVLAVPPTATELPSRALAAVDFSSFSIDAARAAAELLPRGGELHLAHVTWSPAEERETEGVAEPLRTYHAGARLRLETLAEELERHAPVRVSTHLLRGDPSQAMLQLAERLEAGLIAVGSHGYGFFERMVMGSVSGRLLRAAPCSVLVAPPRQAAAPAAPEVELLGVQRAG